MKYICDICGIEFETACSCWKHRRLVHEVCFSQCNKCGDFLPTEKILSFESYSFCHDCIEMMPEESSSRASTCKFQSKSSSVVSNIESEVSSNYSQLQSQFECDKCSFFVEDKDDLSCAVAAKNILKKINNTKCKQTIPNECDKCSFFVEEKDDLNCDVAAKNISKKINNTKCKQDKNFKSKIDNFKNKVIFHTDKKNAKTDKYFVTLKKATKSLALSSYFYCELCKQEYFDALEYYAHDCLQNQTEKHLQYTTRNCSKFDKRKTEQKQPIKKNLCSKYQDRPFLNELFTQFNPDKVVHGLNL